MAAVCLSIKQERTILRNGAPLRETTIGFFPEMSEPTGKIPAEMVRELRALGHDLSNALETIVQATYLITQAGPPENQVRWVSLIDQASQDAVKINNKLRQILREHS